MCNRNLVFIDKKKLIMINAVKMIFSEIIIIFKIVYYNLLA